MAIERKNSCVSLPVNLTNDNKVFLRNKYLFHDSERTCRNKADLFRGKDFDGTLWKLIILPK